jgi:hypothetical protein
LIAIAGTLKNFSVAASLIASSFTFWQKLGVFMKTAMSGQVQPGKKDASHWLDKFNEPYSKKTGMAIFPGSLNVALTENFDWFQPAYQAKIIWFGKDEYGGERDILLLPCKLINLENKNAFLWTPTTAARDRDLILGL